MTWLFAQVWLWSLAAFLLGAVATWLLFVLPLRRRMRLLREELSDRNQALGREWARDVPESSADLDQRDPTAWDILPVESHSGPVEPELAPEPLEPPEPSPDRPFRTGDLSGYWSLRPGAPSGPAGPDAEAAADVPVAERGAGPAGEAETGVHEPVGFVDAHGYDDPAPRPDVPDRGTAPPEFPTAPAEADRDQQYVDRARTVRLTSQPSVSPDAAANDGTSGTEEPVANTWFHEGEWADDGGDDSDGRQSLSGQLRSLFEPLESRGGAPHPGVADTPATAGHVASGEEAPEANGDGDPHPLPRRVPGATSRPGTPPANRPGGDPPVTQQSTQQPPVAEWPSGDVGAAPPGRAPEEWYPDEVNPAADRPGDGYTVKGHFASRQYHTPESPHFDRVAAEVWFHSGAEAEQAGFEPWDGRSRS